ncbi:hypothetical protein GF380_00610 [Candidatus Uhrbacteria bacterium]|nr:hypothetical protein [Candidatus Uhrbacteria bacterium]MBD3283876.1 hypothetical protein [Candidatus Uhrbacteria bacterium]
MSEAIGRGRRVSLFTILLLFAGIVFLMGSVFEFWSTRKQRAMTNAEERLHVITTVFPYYDMARAIAGSDADVTLIVPPGTDPLHYTPSSDDLRRIRTTDLLIVSGLGMEPWLEDMTTADLPDPSNVLIASDASLVVLMANPVYPGLVPEGTEEAKDPYVWLDADNAIRVLHRIRDEFKQAEPELASVFHERALEYEGKLRTIDSLYQSSFENCRTRTFVQGGPRRFGYLSRRYNLEYYATTGLFDDETPSAEDLAGLGTLLNEKALSYVFYESLDSPRMAESVARFNDAGILTLHSGANVNTRDRNETVTYPDLLTSNLDALARSMDCQR